MMINRPIRPRRIAYQLLSIIMSYCTFINYCIGKEQKIFESSGIIEWGGISLRFVDGESTQRVTFTFEKKLLKIKNPKVKSAFDSDKVELYFKRRDSDSSVLSVRFAKSLGDREMVLGPVSDTHWARFRDHAKFYVKIEEQ